jgi:hypothetical protein
MDLIARLFQIPWGPFIMSSVIATATCVAVIVFGMAPKMLVPITYGTVAIYAPLSIWVDRRTGRKG